MDGTTTSLLHPKLVSCGVFKSGVTHGPELFLPVSRLAITDLDENIQEMEKLLGNQLESPLVPNIDFPGFTPLDTTAAIIEQADARLKALSDEVEGREIDSQVPKEMTLRQSEPLIPVSTAALESFSTTPFDMPVMSSATPWIPSTAPSSLMPPTTPSSISTLTPLPESRMSPPPASDIAGIPKDPAGIKSLAVQTFHHSELSDETFQRLWAGGETMVVTDLLPKMHIKWTPEYFINHYGDNRCAITDCDTEMVQPSTVRQFFSQFGNYSHRSGSILKLKDWPPTADFKNAFPALFDDFHRAVPSPNYTRRDGFYNFSAHFPMNAVVPDMGPKMYNAFKSREDGYGSTRLHMDMVCLSHRLR
jgi:[histone H3]-dimethyl-L-lysine9 demethylase